MSAHTIIIDTDPGVDDAMAIHLAFAHPDLDVLGLTTVFGNVDVDRTTRNALVLAEMAAHPALVARGADKPLVQPPNPPADFVHGPQGFGDVAPPAPTRATDPRSAARFLCDMINERPGAVTVCAVGPLTNIALALEHDPSIAEKLEQLVIMGGVLDAKGNVSDWAEANIWNDPHAADAVFAASWPMAMVGLDVTEAVRCTQSDFGDVARAAPEIGGFLNRAAKFYIDFHRRQYGVAACYLHDPSAILYITDPDLFEVEETPLTVLMSGERIGQTVRAPGGDRTAVKVCVGVDKAAVKERFLSLLRETDVVRTGRSDG